MQFNFTQPIAAAVDELLTGTKAELAIKLFGEDINKLEKYADEIAAIVGEVRGAEDVQPDQVTGTPQLLILPDRQAVARYDHLAMSLSERLHGHRVRPAAGCDDQHVAAGQ